MSDVSFLLLSVDSVADSVAFYAQTLGRTAV